MNSSANKKLILSKLSLQPMKRGNTSNFKSLQKTPNRHYHRNITNNFAKPQKSKNTTIQKSTLMNTKPEATHSFTSSSNTEKTSESSLFTTQFNPMPKIAGLKNRKNNQFHNVHDLRSVSELRRENQEKQLQSQAPHSIYNRFIREFTNKMNKTFTDNIKQMKKTIKISNSKKNKNNRRSRMSVDTEYEDDSWTQATPITFTEPSNMGEIYKKGRVRNFEKYQNSDYIFNSTWRIKVGFHNPETKYNNCLTTDLQFQSYYIKSEVTVWFESIQYWKSNWFSSRVLLKSFKNKDIAFQKNINSTLEETWGWLNNIPKLLLLDYNEYTERFINVDQVSPEELKTRTITNEANCFVENVKWFCRITNYVKCCFDVYKILVSQTEDVVLKRKDFNIVRKILDRCRFNISETIMYIKNCLNSYSFDKKWIDKYVPAFDNDMEGFKWKQRAKDYKSIEEHWHEQLQFKKNEFTQKTLRLASVFNANKDNDEVVGWQGEEGAKPVKKKDYTIGNLTLKGHTGPMATIRSELMTKLLKHCPKDTREKIISWRTIERFQKQALESS